LEWEDTSERGDTFGVAAPRESIVPDLLPFTGFPPEALAFFAGLQADNSKRYWEANRPIYERAARQPMQSLIEALDEEFRPMKVFRPYRDVRFAKDKTPYKTHIGAFGEGQGGSGFYIQLSAAGLFVAAGYWDLAPDQLVRWREGVAGEDGTRLLGIIEAVRATGLETGGGAAPSLKRAPRGYPVDHPRVDLLRLKGLTVAADYGDPSWLETPEVVDRVQAAWRSSAPVLAWLDTHIGPSRELPPEARVFIGGG
jgi:uncharacterized protein (TIGR02453 family)